MVAVDEKLFEERTQALLAGQARLETNVNHITDLLKGANSKPGVLDDVRDLKKWRDDQEKAGKRRIGIAVSIGLIFVTQVAVLFRLWIWR
jgi:hypothetical protein